MTNRRCAINVLFQDTFGNEQWSKIERYDGDVNHVIDDYGRLNILRGDIATAVYGAGVWLKFWYDHELEGNDNDDKD